MSRTLISLEGVIGLWRAGGDVDEAAESHVDAFNFAAFKAVVARGCIIPHEKSELTFFLKDLWRPDRSKHS